MKMICKKTKFYLRGYEFKERKFWRYQKSEDLFKQHVMLQKAMREGMFPEY